MNKKPVKKAEKNSKKLEKSGSTPEQKPNTPPPVLPVLDKPVRVSSIRSAKRLLSKLIYALQLRQIDDKTSKTITYLLSVFITIVKEHELEQRIADLEKKMGL